MTSDPPAKPTEPEPPKEDPPQSEPGIPDKPNPHWVPQSDPRRPVPRAISTAELGQAVFTRVGSEFEGIYTRLGALGYLTLEDIGVARLADVPWSPLGEVLETDDAYQVKVELPGLHADQIGVELNNRELVVNGASTRVEEARSLSSTRRTGPFEYRIYLPGDADHDKVSAELADGVLTVTLPKTEVTATHRVEVRE